MTKKKLRDRALLHSAASGSRTSPETQEIINAPRRDRYHAERIIIIITIHLFTQDPSVNRRRRHGRVR